MKLESVNCCICAAGNDPIVGSALDYEYRSTDKEFFFHKCRNCDLVYLNPRPSVSEFKTIYPSNYHAYDFSEKAFGFVYRVRAKLEAKRALSWCEDVPMAAKILDVGCGDGFHLKLLRDYGIKTWSLEGVDFDTRAVKKAREKGLNVHEGSLSETRLAVDSYDLVFMIQTIEHLESPPGMLSDIYKLLKPGGKLVIVTDNTDSVDFKWFKRKYWGGYHTPRHWNLFNKKSLALLGTKCGYQVVSIQTQISPVNWVYTIHNFLKGNRAPEWLVNRFTLRSTVSLGIFTTLDSVLQKTGRGALLRAIFQKPFDT